jgi:8-oxo-dGTP pyrophosphatase MutT (NUDIX family)
VNGPLIPAATLIVVRDSTISGVAPDILMVERAAGMAFAGGALVFPGGRIDQSDYAHAAAIGLPGGGGAVAAIRETIEETGIPAALTPTPDAAGAHRLQSELIAGANFAALLAAAELAINPTALTEFARWLPKLHVNRRFDTMFFLASAPAGDWLPRPFAGESSAAFWLSAGDVLKRERSGDARLIFPTRRNLERLAQHASFGAMVADAQSHPIEPITPWIEEYGCVPCITIPGNLGYPIVREPVDGLWRG